MKNFILFALTIAVSAFQLNSQNTVLLNINHKLGNADFAMNQAAKNNIDNDFNITRLEYYISEITLVHDGGAETMIDDLWVLINAGRGSGTTKLDLGTYGMTTVEKIRFHIGVDEAHNHLDPSSWPTDHPLAPKSPSMHWGWAAGYRFVALEGFGGPDLNQMIQLHGLDDSNYFTTELELDVVADNNEVTINIDADYTRALEDIAVNSGVIEHGVNRADKQCLENFRDYVFTQASGTSSTIDFSEISSFDLFPNPITNSISTVKLELNESGYAYDISLTSVDGRQLDYHYNVTDNYNLDFTDQQPGMYFVNLVKEGQPILTKKVIVE